MKPNDKDINKITEPYKHLKPPFTRTEADVWHSIESELNQPIVKRPFYKQRSFYVAVAATITLFLGLTSFFHFYTVHHITARGETAQITLPDGSTVDINAASQLSYKPYWWRFERKVSLNGEAFFKVKKGAKFSVVSGYATTTVLGTSFNISLRNNTICITCISGIVKVEANQNEVILKANNQIKFNQGDTPEINNNVNPQLAIAWSNAEFFYESKNLNDVYNDIALQYNIDITLDDGIIMDSLLFSGYFKKDNSVENVLNLVGRPFGFKTVKTHNRLYFVTHEN